jgi:hypothetical protein
MTIANACYGMLLDPEGPAPVPARAVAAALICAAVPLALAWKARAGEWYLIAAIVCPPLLSLLASILGTHAFTLRYLLFANVFFLIGLAVLICRWTVGWRRSALSAFVLAWFLFVDGYFWHKLDIDGKPGARGAAEAIAIGRRPGEPVIVSSPLFFFPMLYHLQDRSDCFLFGDRHDVPHYQGRAVLTAEDLISGQQLQELGGDRIWVVDMAGGHWGNKSVPVPANWAEISRQSFPEVYWPQGNVIVLQYQPSASLVVCE